MKDIADIEGEDELVDIINETETKISELQDYLVELESAKEKNDEFNEKMEADINSNRY
tara:strand:+ start:1283 stop:1456 length:174 start_codon:yes stop_codon:yes gene_type:complete